MAASARRPLAVRSLRLDRHAAAGPAVEEAHGLPRARLSGRRRLHGSRQLGHVARRRLEVRLRAADGCAALQPDGDPAAGAVRAARHRIRPRPGAGLPRRFSPCGLMAALGDGGDRDLRDRSRRGHRHRDRSQPLVRRAARARRLDHGARRVPDPVDAEPGLPLDRGLHRDAARRHCAMLRYPDRDGRSGLGRGDSRFRPDHPGRHQSGYAVSGARYPRRHRHAP